MPKIILAAPIDPESGGVGYFEYLLDNIEREKLLLEFFAFLEVPIVEVYTFVSDYLIRFKNEKLEVVVRNDDFGCEELGTLPEETVFFAITAASETDLVMFQKKLELHIQIARVS